MLDRQRAALELIAARGCDAAAAYPDENLSWDTCRDYEYREERPTGNANKDRCDPCIAHTALVVAAPDHAPRIQALLDEYKAIEAKFGPPESLTGSHPVTTGYPDVVFD